MNKTRRAPSLQAFVLVALLGCASGSEPIDPAAVRARVAASQAEFRALADSTIEDPARAATFVRLIDERDALIAQHSETVRRYAEAMRTLNADYDATRENFEQVILAYNSERRIAQTRFVDLMTRMKAATTEKEWKVLAKYDLEELNPRELVYSSGAR